MKYDKLAIATKMLLPLLPKPARERYAEGHRMESELEAYRELAAGEAKSLVEARDSLRKKMDGASAEEKIRFYRDFEETERLLRLGGVLQEAFECFPAVASTATPRLEAGLPDRANTSEHWFDEFKNFAQRRNEPWRKTLLARALAAELTEPGTVTTRLLWTIGTIEGWEYESFCSLQDISCSAWTSSYRFFPIVGRVPESMTLPSGDNVRIVESLLDDCGLYRAGMVRSVSLSHGESLFIRYGAQVFQIESKKLDGELGYLFTSPTGLGNQLAELCVSDRMCCKLGYQSIHQFLSELNLCHVGLAQIHEGSRQSVSCIA